MPEQEAKVPYTPFPTVRPDAKLPGKEAVSFPQVEISNAVGKALNDVGTGYDTLGRGYRAVGEAWGNLGAHLESAGKELGERAIALHRVELDNETDKIRIGLNNDIMNVVENHLANPNPGSAGPNIAQITKMRDDAISKLGTDYQRNRLRSQTADMIGTEGRIMMRHSGQAMKEDVIRTAKATSKLLQDDLGKAETPEQRDKATQAIRDHVVGTWGPAMGTTNKAQLEEEYRRIVDAGNAQRMDRLAQEKPLTALEEYKKGLEPAKEGEEPRSGMFYNQGVANQVYGSILENSARAIARGEAQKAHQGDPDRPLEEKMPEALKAAEENATKLGLPQPAIEKTVEETRGRLNNLDSDYRHQKTQAENLNRHNIADMIMGNNPNKKKINTPEELWTYGGEKLKAQWARGSQEDKDYWMDLLNRPEQSFAKNDALFDSIMGAMKYGDDPHRVAAMGLQVGRLPMSIDQIQAVHKEQERLLAAAKKAEEELHTEKAFTTGRDNGWIPRGLKKYSEDYFTYMRNLELAIGDMTREKRRELKDEDFKEIFRRLNRKVIGWGGEAGKETMGERPLGYVRDVYEHIPKKELERIQRNNPNATPGDIERAYMRYARDAAYDEILNKRKYPPEAMSPTPLANVPGTMQGRGTATPDLTRP